MTHVGRYHSHGDLLLDDYEFAGGIRPEPKIVAARRAEITEGIAFTAPLSAREQLPITPPADYERRMADAVADRHRQLGRLGVQARMIAQAAQESLPGPLFGDDQGRLF